MNLVDLPGFICLYFVIEMNKNNAFNTIDRPSKTKNSLSFCNLPPQAIANGITLSRLKNEKQLLVKTIQLIMTMQF